MKDLALLLDLFGNSKEIKLLMHGDFCLVFTVSAKLRVELRAKIGHYRNRCFMTLIPHLTFTETEEFSTEHLGQVWHTMIRNLVQSLF